MSNVENDLRRAAARLRERGEGPTIEPLASWLEEAARVAGEHPQDPEYAGLPYTRFCTMCQDEETTCVSYVTHALAVARALTEGEVSSR